MRKGKTTNPPFHKERDMKKIFIKLLNIFISIVGMKFILRKYVLASEIVRDGGKKITVLILSGTSLLNDGILHYHLNGGLFSTFGNTIIVLDTVLSSISKEEFGFFLNHEVGHIVLGHVHDLIKSGGSSNLDLCMEQEIEADNYARRKGYNTPNFRNLLTVVYSELASAEIITKDEIPKCVEETIEGMTYRL